MLTLLILACRWPSDTAPPPAEVPELALPSVDHARRTTSGDAARATLDVQITQLHASVDTIPGARLRLVEALILRASLFGSVRDLDHALAVAGDGPERATALMAVHRFDEALAIDPSKADAVRLARHQDLGELEARRRAEVAARPSTDSWSALGDVLVAQRRPADADAAFAEALRAYRDVSPLTVARLQFRRGLACCPLRSRINGLRSLLRRHGFRRAFAQPIRT